MIPSTTLIFIFVRLLLILVNDGISIVNISSIVFPPDSWALSFRVLMRFVYEVDPPDGPRRVQSGRAVTEMPTVASRTR